ISRPNSRGKEMALVGWDRHRPPLRTNKSPSHPSSKALYAGTWLSTLRWLSTMTIGWITSPNPERTFLITDASVVGENMSSASSKQMISPAEILQHAFHAEAIP